MVPHRERPLLPLDQKRVVSRRLLCPSHPGLRRIFQGVHQQDHPHGRHSGEHRRHFQTGRLRRHDVAPFRGEGAGKRLLHPHRRDDRPHGAAAVHHDEEPEGSQPVSDGGRPGRKDAEGHDDHAPSHLCDHGPHVDGGVLHLHRHEQHHRYPRYAHLELLHRPLLPQEGRKGAHRKVSAQDPDGGCGQKRQKEKIISK